MAYANRKISLGLSLPIANFVAGIAVARLGKIKWFLIASLILGATFAFSWTNYASAEAYWEQSAAGQAETNITYQGVAYVIGLGALAAGLIAWQTRKPIALLLSVRAFHISVDQTIWIRWARRHSLSGRRYCRLFSGQPADNPDSRRSR